MNTKFKAVPENHDFKIHFKLTENQLADWLLALSHLGSKNACLQILYLLQFLNKTKLSTKNRSSFLKISNDYLEQYIKLLKSTCQDVSFPLSEQDQECIEIITWSYLTLAESFFLAADNSTNRDAEVFALYMALQAIAKAQLHIAAVYAEPGNGFWSLAYKIFSQAEKSRLLDLEINETTLKDITINQMVAEILVFYLCDTSQFRPKEMQTIFNFLSKVCNNLAIYPLKSINFQTEILKINYFQALKTMTGTFDYLLEKVSTHLIGREDLFVLCLDKDTPPVNSKNNLTHITPATRFFCPQQVADNIYKRIEIGDVGGGVLKSINTELFTRVAKALEPGQKRKYDRTKENKSVLGVIGFEAVISFLYKIGKKNSLQAVKPVEASKNKFSTYEELKAYTDSLKTKPIAITDEHSDFELSYRFRAPDSTPGNIWHNRNHTVKTPTEKVLLKKMTVLDSSSKGYSVSWDKYGESTAKVGDIFGMISEDKKRLEVALIRRVSINANQDIICGCEILGFKSEIVYITHTYCEIGAEEGGDWAIFIRGSEQLEHSDSIIYNSSHFNAGDMVYLHRNHKITQGLLMTQLHAGGTISHIELKYPNK